MSRVDGEYAYRNQVVTAPGTRKVTVDLPPRPGFKVGAQETFDLQASPCMRYFIAAKPDTPAGDSWKAVVRSERADRRVRHEVPVGDRRPR